MFWEIFMSTFVSLSLVCNFPIYFQVISHTLLLLLASANLNLYFFRFMFWIFAQGGGFQAHHQQHQHQHHHYQHHQQPHMNGRQGGPRNPATSPKPQPKVLVDSLEVYDLGIQYSPYIVLGCFFVTRRLYQVSV